MALTHIITNQKHAKKCTSPNGTSPNGNRIEDIATPLISSPDPYVLSYSYDHAGNVTSVTDYAGNEYAYTYTYDILYRTNTIKRNNSVITDYDYHTNVITGEPTKVTYPEGTVNYTYDNALNVTSQLNSLNDGSVIADYEYTYDIIGNQTQKKETSNGTVKITGYEYDDANRLITEISPDGTETSYEFDNQNNISEKTITDADDVESVLTYTYNNLNQLTNISELITGAENTTTKNTDFTYDANGNTLTKRTYGQADEESQLGTYIFWHDILKY